MRCRDTMQYSFETWRSAYTRNLRLTWCLALFAGMVEERSEDDDRSDCRMESGDKNCAAFSSSRKSQRHTSQLDQMRKNLLLLQRNLFSLLDCYVAILLELNMRIELDESQNHAILLYRLTVLQPLHSMPLNPLLLLRISSCRKYVWRTQEPNGESASLL